MDIIGAIERNPKVAAAALGVMIGVNVVSLTVSGVYVHSVNKACEENRASLAEVQSQLTKLNNLLESASEENDEDTEKQLNYM